MLSGSPMAAEWPPRILSRARIGRDADGLQACVSAGQQYYSG